MSFPAIDVTPVPDAKTEGTQTGTQLLILTNYSLGLLVLQNTVCH